MHLRFKIIRCLQVTLNLRQIAIPIITYNELFRVRDANDYFHNFYDIYKTIKSKRVGNRLQL